MPIYHGKIDKTLFQASLEAVGGGRLDLADVERAAPDARALRRDLLFAPAGFSASGRFFAAATLALSASMRSMTGASSAGSGTAISSPRSFALEHRLQVAPVPALASARLELPGEAVDHLPRELELRVLDVGLADRLGDLRLGVHVLGEEEVSSASAPSFARTRQRLSCPARTKRPRAAVSVCRIASSRST